MGKVQPVKSKYYADQVVDEVSGTHYDADTGEVVGGPIVLEPLETDERAENLRAGGIFLGVTVLISALACGIGAIWNNGYLVLLALGAFGAGFAMPMLRASTYAEDDASDIPLGMALMFLFGPLVGGLIYGAVCIMRQDFSPGIVGLFLSFLIVRLPLELATHHPSIVTALFPFTLATGVEWAAHLTGHWLMVASLFGWMSAAWFRQTDE